MAGIQSHQDHILKRQLPKIGTKTSSSIRFCLIYELTTLQYDLAEKLIQLGKAYVCSCNGTCSELKQANGYDRS